MAYISDFLTHFANFLISCSENPPQAELFTSDPEAALQQAGFEDWEIEKVRPLFGSAHPLTELRERLATNPPTDEIEIAPAIPPTTPRPPKHPPKKKHRKKPAKKKVAKKKKPSKKR